MDDVHLPGSCEPWHLTRAELVPYAQTFPLSHGPDLRPRSYCEADLYEYTVSRRLAETIPPEVPSFPVGTWSMDRFDSLWHLRRFPISTLLFPGGDPYAVSWGWNAEMRPWLIEKYVTWLHAGHEPPPLTACEMERGGVKVLDGHNRAAALVRVGRHETLVWVSVAYVKPNGFCTDLTHRIAVERALRAGMPVPARVLADYPHLAQGANSSHSV